MTTATFGTSVLLLLLYLVCENASHDESSRQEEIIEPQDDIWTLLIENVLASRRYKSDGFRRCGVDALEFVNSVCKGCTKLSGVATVDAILKGCCHDGCTQRFVQDNACCTAEITGSTSQEI
uniref:Uncharacterized protein n=1 Tax=Steinernema glaseri TaxID=37863 RepID=A0A1I8AGD1_9BILA